MTANDDDDASLGATLTATLSTTNGVARPDDQPGSSVRDAAIGRYMLISQAGTGAMGVVFAAYDPQLDRKVALKILKPRGSNLSRSRERLQREAQALAKLGHPNVVAVYDVGVHEQQLFVAMEFVEGQTIGAWMQSAPAVSTASLSGVGSTRAGPIKIRPWREVLEVFIQAGRGLAAAHEAGLIHRDFKPDNMMLSEDGRVRVMDFGLARVDGGEVTDAFDHNARVDSLTQTGAMMGTPAYMSLEQFSGTQVDARSDQFSFCVTLHEALYGERPFAGESVGELVIALQEGVLREPIRGAQVPSWVRAVVLRGLATKPEDRFTSMQALLGALVADPVARRRRIALRLGLGLALVGGLWGVIALSGKLVQRDEVIEDQASELELKNAELEHQLAEQARLLSAQRGLRAKSLIDTGSEAEALLLGIQAVGAHADAWDQAPREAVEGLEQVLAHDTIIVGATHMLEGHTDYLTHVAYSPDGIRLATTSLDGSARIWDPVHAKLLTTLDHHQEKLFHLVFSPDGARVATASAAGRARIWNVESGELLATLEGSGAAFTALAFSPDGSELAGGAQQHAVRIWDVETGERRVMIAADRKGSVSALAYTPDGEHLVTAGGDGKARVWDAGTGELVATLAGHQGPIFALAISPDGTQIATGGLDKRARTWSLETGELIATLEGHEDRITNLVYSPDGTRLVTVSWDRTGRVHDPETGELVATLTGGHGAGVVMLAYAPNGGSVATGGYGGSVVIWDPKTGKLRAKLRGHKADIWGLAFSPDGGQLATASVDCSIRLWDIDDFRVAVLDGPEVDVENFAYSPDYTRIATVSRDGQLRLWSSETSEHVLTFEDDNEDEDWKFGDRASIAYSPDGTQLASVDQRRLKIWDTQTGALTVTKKAPAKDDGVFVRYSPAGTQIQVCYANASWSYDARTHELLTTVDTSQAASRPQYSPDDTQLAFLTVASTFQIWDTQTGTLVAERELPEDQTTQYRYSPDGTQIAISSQVAGIRVLDARTLALRVTLASSSKTESFDYAPSGTRLAGSTYSEGVRIWDVETGELIRNIISSPHEGRTHRVAYAQVGSRLAVLGNGFFRTHDSETGELIAYIETRRASLYPFVFWPDATRLTNLSKDHTLEVWDAETGETLTRERIGVAREDGSSTWPIPHDELTRIGCARLQVFERTHPMAQDICAPLLGAGQSY